MHSFSTRTNSEFTRKKIVLVNLICYMSITLLDDELMIYKKGSALWHVTTNSQRDTIYTCFASLICLPLHSSSLATMVLSSCSLALLPSNKFMASKQLRTLCHAFVLNTTQPDQVSLVNNFIQNAERCTKAYYVLFFLQKHKKNLVM